jgi:hypothetical protein
MRRDCDCNSNISRPATKDSHLPMKNKLLILLCAALSACETTRQFAASPAGQELQKAVIAAAKNALQQYEDTGRVKGKEVAIASLSSVSQQVRGLQATEAAANPNALKEAVKNGSASSILTQKVAPAVAAAVVKAVKNGVPKDVANETAASALDKVAAKQ